MKDITSVLSNGIHLPPGICQMTAEAFEAVVTVLITQGNTPKEAYEIVERAHVKLFDKPRYSGGYESFRKVRARIYGTLSQ